MIVDTKNKSVTLTREELGMLEVIACRFLAFDASDLDEEDREILKNEIEFAQFVSEIYNTRIKD